MVRHRAARAGILVLDATLINVAFVLSYIVRYQLELPYPVDPQYDAPFHPYLPFAVLLTLLCLAMYAIDGLYTVRRRPRLVSQIYRVINGTTTSIVIIMALTFFLQPLVYSRGMLVLAGALIILFLSLARLTSHAVTLRRRRKGIGVERVLVVGAGEVGRAVMRTILADPMLGYQVAGYLDDDPSKGNGLGRIKSLGTLDNLAGAISEAGVNEVIVTLPWMYHRRITQIVEFCEHEGVRVRVVPDVFQRSMRSLDLDSLSGIPLITPVGDRITSGARLAKRTTDLVLSVVVLPFLALIYVVAAVAIKLDSRGPVIFRQQRIGKDGHPFEVYKFRTMIQGADKLKDQVAHLSKYQGDTLLKVPNDPRMTRVGRFLRHMSIDELPQVINVLQGEMSWVGPRPNTPDEVEQYEPWQRKRLSVLPGITGLWQVSGRSDVPFDEMCLLDIFYIENWSLELDIRIILQTVPQIIFGNGAY
jgi:exopolysaccharide biosynthesis polyprenyl glycosylphosphotransferase